MVSLNKIIKQIAGKNIMQDIWLVQNDVCILEEKDKHCRLPNHNKDF